MLALIAAAALLQFAPIDAPLPPGVPAGSFDLHGFTADHQETPAPVLVHGEDGRDRVFIAFLSPVDGKCIIAQLVTVGDKPMRAVLAGNVVTKDEPEFVRASLPSAKDLVDNGVTSTGTTIVVECGDPEDASTWVASRFYYIGPSSST